MCGTRGNSRATLRIFGALVLGTVCVGASVVGLHIVESWLATSVMMALVGAGAGTSAWRWWAQSRTAASAAVPRRRMLLIGSGEAAEHLARLADTEGWDVLDFVDYLERTSEAEWESGTAIPSLVRELGVDRVVVAHGASVTWDLVEQIDDEDQPVDVYVVPDAYELALGRPTSMRIGDVALVRLSRGKGRRIYRNIKRAADVALSVMVMLIFGPLIALSMLAIRMSSPGPVLFRQQRVGKNGVLFDVIKLRTMVMDAEKAGPRLCDGLNDPRLTPIGTFLRRTHLDELPQVWNVLKGEMSFVGPRPERPVFVEQFSRELPRYNERHRIQPGITGLAQVNGYYHSSPREKLRFDLMYIYHRSLWLDLSILVRTFIGVFK